MEFIELLDFLAVYSIPTLVIALISAIVKLLLDRFLSNKLGKNLLSVIPFALSCLLNFAYDCIFINRCLNFSEATLTAGLISGSLASLFVALFYRIKTGKLSDIGDSVKLVLEGVLKNYVRADMLIHAVLKVKDLIEKASENLEHDHDTLINLIADAIKECSEDGITDDEIKAVALLAVNAVNQLKNR